jgi:hypothetical protein
MLMTPQGCSRVSPAHMLFPQAHRMATTPVMIVRLT